MAEEDNNKNISEQTPSCCSPGSVVKVLVGLIFISIGLWSVIRWWSCLWMVVKGCVGVILILIGAITIAIAKE